MKNKECEIIGENKIVIKYEMKGKESSFWFKKKYKDFQRDVNKIIVCFLGVI